MARDLRGLDQQEVAVAIGVARPTVSQWEAGTKFPGRKNLQALAMFFQIKVDDLLEDADIHVGNPAPLSVDWEILTLFSSSSFEVKQAVLTLLKAASQIAREDGEITKK